MSRPEHLAPPEIFYAGDEAKKYATNSRMREIQTSLTERAIQLLNLPEEGMFLLDVGAGSGLSGECLTENGHFWTGCDISKDMLEVAVSQEFEGDMVLNDMGQGLPFRPGSFDGAISISAIQWLCNAEGSSANPYKRLLIFFTTLYRSLVKGGRAVLQWYPENAHQMELVTSSAMRCGFGGGLLVDYPHSTRAKKYFLVLYAGSKDGTKGGNMQMPAALGTGAPGDAPQHNMQRGNKHQKGRHGVQKEISHKDWVKNKKQRQRMQGKEVKEDSKYTGRKRKPKF